MAYESYCASCTYMEECAHYDGSYYCDRKGADVFANDAKCYRYCEAYGRSNSSRENMYKNSIEHRSGGGCYLTTAMCDILHSKDDNYYLNTLRKFREYMKTKKELVSLLVMYDLIGPEIANRLYNDEHGLAISKYLYENYIAKSVSAIELEKYQLAIDTYIEMTSYLAKRYEINLDILYIDPNSVNDKDRSNKNLGHARILAK